MSGHVVPLRDDRMLQAALRYIQLGAAILPLWWVEDDGRCACGQASCTSPGKHPIGRLVPRGVKGATKNDAIIKQWWTAYPKANIGIATGRISGIVVVDVDGQKGETKLNLLLGRQYNSGERMCFVETGRAEGGRHLYFLYPANTNIPNHNDDGLEVKSDGAYVVVPPSRHASGKLYEWKNLTDKFEECPRSVVDFAVKKRKLRESAAAPEAGERPAARLSEELFVVDAPSAWSEAEEEKIRSALAFIPADDRKETWLAVGLALHWTQWERARTIWDDWSKKSSKYEAAEQDKAWASFAKPYKGRRITLGTLYFLAEKYGYEGPLVEKINALNKRHFLIRNIGGKCLVGEMMPSHLGTGQTLSLQTTDAFKTWYANCRISVHDHQGKVKLIPLGAAWLEHPKRRQYETVELVPNSPPELPNGGFNLWRGFGVEPEKGVWPLTHAHIRDVLADGDPEGAEYILRFAAWCFQHPGELAEAALVFRGGKGSGKGVFGNALCSVFGEHALHIFHQNHLTGNFNGHLRSCLLLFADEAFWAGDKKGESVLKGLITERALVIEQKGIDAVPWPNRLHLVMAANADWVVPASHDERRFAVFDVSNRYAQGASPEGVRKSYFDALHWELQNGGLAAMLYDLLERPLGDWHPRQVYETEGLKRQKDQSMPPIEQWFDELLQEGKLPGYTGKRASPDTQALMSHAQLRVPRLRGYLSEKAMGDFLRKQGCIPVRTNQVRGWQFPPLAKMREAWARRYSGRVWEAPELQDWQQPHWTLSRAAK
jgi:hypothetical protein